MCNFEHTDTKRQTQPEQPKQRNQTYKYNLNKQNNEINVGFTSKTKFMLLQLRHCKFLSIHIQTLQLKQLNRATIWAILK